MRTNSQASNNNFSQFLIKKLISKKNSNSLKEDEEELVPEEAWAKKKVLEHSKLAKDQGTELSDEQLYQLVLRDLNDANINIL